MQNIHGIRPSGEVNHTVRAAWVQNANLLDALADGGHRLEIVRLLASLDLIELIARIMSRVVGKVSQAFQRIAKETHRPHD